MKSDKVKQLRKLLIPLIHEEASRIDSFLEDDMEGFIGFVEAFQVEDKVIAFLKSTPNVSTQELYKFFSDNTGEFPPGQEDILESDEDVDISELSEYHQMLLTRYDWHDLDEEEKDILYFMIGNPQYIGIEEKALESMKAHPKDTLIDFYERYIEEIIPPEYRKELAEKFGWELED